MINPPKKFQIFRQNDTESAAAEAGENLNSLLIENKKNPVLLMLSAGSCLSILDYVGKTALGENLTVSMLDERFSEKPEINNFAQLQKLDFYTDAFEAETSFFGTLPRPDDTMETCRARWEKNLKTWVEENPKGIIIATLGMGPDGHTAGIFPYPENPDKFDALFKTESWAIAYDAVGKHKFSQRITTTPLFFKKINFGVAFVSGADKKAKFDQIELTTLKPADFPVMLWHEIKDVKVFTDLE